MTVQAEAHRPSACISTVTLPASLSLRSWRAASKPAKASPPGENRKTFRTLTFESFLVASSIALRTCFSVSPVTPSSMRRVAISSSLIAAVGFFSHAWERLETSARLTATIEAILMVETPRRKEEVPGATRDTTPRECSVDFNPCQPTPSRCSAMEWANAGNSGGGGTGPAATCGGLRARQRSGRGTQPRGGARSVACLSLLLFLGVLLDVH